MSSWGPGYGDLGKHLSQQARRGRAVERAANATRRPYALDHDDLPEPADVPVGVSFFVRDYGMPLWSNGVAWVNALGLPAGSLPGEVLTEEPVDTAPAD